MWFKVLEQKHYFSYTKLHWMLQYITRKIMFNKYFDKYGYAEVQNKLKIGKIKGDV